MSNMSYCRFENTLSDLNDCEEHFLDEGLSTYEKSARRKLIAVCKRIVEMEDELGEVEENERRDRIVIEEKMKLDN